MMKNIATTTPSLLVVLVTLVLLLLSFLLTAPHKQQHHVEDRSRVGARALFHVMPTSENDEEDDNDPPLLEACQGGCNRDSDCAQGLNCFHRSFDESVPGCRRERRGVNYCFDAFSTSTSISTQDAENTEEQDSGCIYQPGLWTVHQHGLLLSQGLLARVIAEEGFPVRFDGDEADRRESDIAFHTMPDGAAVFTKPGTDGGWVYVSNSEGIVQGGVGAIYFNSRGQAIDYKMILTGTRRNCGGGKTYWNTWISCEEHDDGRVWEVDPWGEWAQRTIVGAVRAKYESAAYDNRNRSDPKFFVSIDEDDGPLLRFTPSPLAVNYAVENNDYTNLLHTSGSGAKWEYLVLDYNQDKAGTFTWTSDIRKGRASASRYFQGLEGVDVYEGMLYMTAKEDRLLFILDLDNMTFEETSTRSGAFDSAPDQVKRLLDHDGILYFCEDGSTGSGVHGRDLDGNYFTILQADRDFDGGMPRLVEGETSGLAFSPDNMFMYVSFQKEGRIFEVRRADGLPFNGRRLDIKYHYNP